MKNKKLNKLCVMMFMVLVALCGVVFLSLNFIEGYANENIATGIAMILISVLSYQYVYKKISE